TLVDETLPDATTRRVATVQLPMVLSNVTGGAGDPYTVELQYSGDANFAPAAGTGTVHVRPFPVVIQIDNAFKYYGDPDPTFTFSSIPAVEDLFLDTDAFVGFPGRPAGEDVGTYEIQ